MKFYESGIPGGRTVLLLPGNFMTHRQFEVIAPLLAEEHRVICVDFDGYDETGETTYTTAQDQAEKIAAYIRENLGGRIDLVYAESLGSCPAAFLTQIPDLSIGGVILSGTQYLHWGILDPVIVALTAPMTCAVILVLSGVTVQPVSSSTARRAVISFLRCFISLSPLLEIVFSVTVRGSIVNADSAQPTLAQSCVHGVKNALFVAAPFGRDKNFLVAVARQAVDNHILRQN